MVVAVAIVGVMQMPIHQVTNVITMRNRFVATARTVNVIFIVSTTLVVRCATIRIGF